MVYTLKNGKTFTFPSMFVNPQNPRDVESLWKSDEEFGLPHIDGILVNMIDFHEVYGKLALDSQPILSQEKPSLREKIRIIDPSYHVLLTGAMEEKARMLTTGFFDKKIEKATKQIMHTKLSPSDKTRIIVNDIYPNLTVKPAIDFLVKNKSDAIVSPCVNLSSKRWFGKQVDKAREMLMDTRALLTTSYKAYSEKHDLMNIVTIQKDVVTERNFATLFRLLLCNDPDQVGIRVMGIQESDTVFLDTLFAFIRQFNLFMRLREKRTQIPIHLVNIDEIGYSGYCNGVVNIVSPIASNPYYKFSSTSSDEDRDMSGRYYHPFNMNYPYLSTITKLPCSCAECKRFKQVSAIPVEYRPTFRRKHWLRVKDNEIQQLRETPARLDVALRDKFANSMRVGLVAYIPASPIFNTFEKER
jgi:hypothetical protein